MASDPLIRGFTTNPTLMRKAGVADYKSFAIEALNIVTDRPISFEVFADDFDEMEAQALEIASWGGNVNVKIPVTNTRGDSSVALVGRLSGRGVMVNVTAMFTLDQVRAMVDALDPETPAILSVFAGRVADSGRDPVPHMKAVVELAAGAIQDAERETLGRELIAFCRERLASYKCPRSVDFRDALPRSDTGKLFKRRLRDEYWVGAGRHV